MNAREAKAERRRKARSLATPLDTWQCQEGAPNCGCLEGWVYQVGKGCLPLDSPASPAVRDAKLTSTEGRSIGASGMGPEDCKLNPGWVYIAGKGCMPPATNDPSDLNPAEADAWSTEPAFNERTVLEDRSPQSFGLGANGCDASQGQAYLAGVGCVDYEANANAPGCYWSNTCPPACYASGTCPGD